MKKYQVWTNGNILHGHVYADSKKEAYVIAHEEVLNDSIKYGNNKTNKLPYGTKLFLCEISENYYSFLNTPYQQEIFRTT